MATRSLNKASLIGNLTRDPELRYTPSGTPVCSFGLATNRSWVASGSDARQEETEFHSIVAWSKLAELCAQLLAKGRKVYIEGRLQTGSWETQAGEKRTKTEIVAEDMIILDSKYKTESGELVDRSSMKKDKDKDKDVDIVSKDSSESDSTPAESKDKADIDEGEKKETEADQTSEMDQAIEAEGTDKPKEEEPKEEEKKEDIDLDKIPF